MNAEELLTGLASLAGSRDAGATDGVTSSRLVNGVEYANAASSEETRLRATWKRRKAGGPTPLVLLADHPDHDGRLRVLGPKSDGPLRTLRAEALLELVARTVALSRLEAVRQVAQEVERLDTEGVAGLAMRGLGTEHLYRERLPRNQARWEELERLTSDVPLAGWRELLSGIGYEIEPQPRRGYLARHEGAPVLVVHPKRSAGEFARLDEAGRLPEGALVADCQAEGAPYGLLVAGTRLRLLSAAADDAGATTRYLELDARTLEPENRPLLGLLAPRYLADGGFGTLLAEARDYGAKLRERIDLALRQSVLPRLGRELGRWAETGGRDLADEGVREELERAALTFVFRALFLLYAESAGHLPMDNPTYAQRSFTRIAERAWEESERADPRSVSLWRDVQVLVEAMRTGQRAWGVPAYNGALFASDQFDGATVLETAAIADAALGPALVDLARDPDDPALGADFSGLEIGHLGHIYEGLLSLRLSLADRDFRYDQRADRYVQPGDEEAPDVRRGELLWLTNEGGRKGGGVYYTRSELVRHLVRGAVRPAFDAHLEEVRALAERDPEQAAARLFDFHVLDPACGSAHFLVEVVDELADRMATLLGDVALPALRRSLDSLRAAAGPTFGAGIEDTALLKRLALKRCVYGVDLSPMGGEIAKVSLWLGSFVPGLSLAYLDHNIQVGNSLIGVARPETLTSAEPNGQVSLFADALQEAMAGAAVAAAELRRIEDRTPDEVAASQAADEALHDRVASARRVLDLWVAEPLGLPRARREALERGRAILEGQESLLGDRAAELARSNRVLHWPLAFAEVFARERPGFDAVVGNPPWEEITVEEQSFYALYRPGIRRGSSEESRRAAVAQLVSERPELPAQFAEAQRRASDLRRYFAAEYETSVGDTDVYKIFCQRYQELVRYRGWLGVVLPRGAFMLKGSEAFRTWLFNRARPQRIDFLLNNRRWAFNTHAQSTFALISAQTMKPKQDEETEVAGVARSAKEFASQSRGEGLRLRRQALGPRLEVPLLENQAAATLLAKVRSGIAFPDGAGRWQCFPVAEFHETNDRGLWAGAHCGWPLWKGESFDQFDPHGAGERLCPPGEKALAKARKSRPGAGSLLAGSVKLEQRREAVQRGLGRARIAFKDVTQRTNSRTVIACLVPERHFLVNSAPYLAFIDDNRAAEAACIAIMNSLVFDWQARRLAETHLSFFVLEGLRLPALDAQISDALATPAARLSCPDERFADFAAAVGVEHGPLEPAERVGLRAELDALVARAYELEPDELELVFSDFTEDAVPASYRDEVRERFLALV